METPTQGLSLRTEVEFAQVGRLLFSKLHWLLLSGLGALLLTAAAVTFLIPPRYQSGVTFYVRNSTGDGTVTNSDVLAAEALAVTYTHLLQSNAVSDAVLERARQPALGEALTRDALQEMTEVSVVDGTQIIRLTVTGESAEQAFEVADAYAAAAPALLAGIAQGGRVDVVDGAERASAPVSPHRAADCVLGFLAGAVLAGLFFVFRMAAAPGQEKAGGRVRK